LTIIFITHKPSQRIQQDIQKKPQTPQNRKEIKTIDKRKKKKKTSKKPPPAMQMLKKNTTKGNKINAARKNLNPQSKKVAQRK
jgi:hypothetical protein